LFGDCVWPEQHTALFRVQKIALHVTDRFLVALYCGTCIGTEYPVGGSGKKFQLDKPLLNSFEHCVRQMAFFESNPSELLAIQIATLRV
jgi:hypothetical protein